MFGVVSTLFFGLAFAGVIYAIFLQRDELALQREELKLTRTELERSAKAQEESTDLLKRQLDVQVLPAFEFDGLVESAPRDSSFNIRVVGKSVYNLRIVGLTGKVELNRARAIKPGIQG
jgi:hypothetical protein